MKSAVNFGKAFGFCAEFAGTVRKQVEAYV